MNGTYSILTSNGLAWTNIHKEIKDGKIGNLESEIKFYSSQVYIDPCAEIKQMEKAEMQDEVDEPSDYLVFLKEFDGQKLGHAKAHLIDCSKPLSQIPELDENHFVFIEESSFHLLTAEARVKGIHHIGNSKVKVLHSKHLLEEKLDKLN